MTRTAKFRVFLSAVTAELQEERQTVARVLRRKGLEVEDQDHLRMLGGSLLEALRDYIAECDAVVALIGQRPGELASKEHASALGEVNAFREFCASAGFEQASYTQWELILAREFGKKLFAFMAPDPAPVLAASESREPVVGPSPLQENFRRWVRGIGIGRERLTTREKLVEGVLVLDFPDLSGPKPIVLPAPSIKSRFKGRDKNLDEIRRELRREHGPGTSGIACLVLHGHGGIGKTRLALEYAYREEPDYTALLFASAESPERLHASLCDLAQPLGADVTAAKEQKQLDPRLDAVLQRLADRPGWLLILDNADTPEAVAGVEHLLHRLHGGHLLITSRTDRWGPGVACRPIELLDQEVAAQMILEHTDGRRVQLANDGDLARNLAAELCGLPLSIELAAAFVAARRCSLADYARRWQAHDASLMDFEPEFADYPRALRTTWEVTNNTLSPRALAIARLLSWLAARPLPREVLATPEVSGLVDRCLASSGPGSTEVRVACTIDELSDSIGDLLSLSVLIPTGSRQDGFFLHPLVQGVTRQEMSEGERALTLDCAARLIHSSAPAPVQPASWGVMAPLAPHLRMVIGHLVLREDAPTARRLALPMAVYLRQRQRFDDTVELMDRLVADEPLDDLNLIRLVLSRAEALHFLDRFVEAEADYRACARQLEATDNRESSDYSAAMEGVGWCLSARGQVREAMRCYQIALEIQESLVPEGGNEVAQRVNSLATGWMERGFTPLALELFERALGLTRSAPGDWWMHEIAVLLNLGECEMDLGNPDIAKKHWLEAVAASERQSTEHTDTAVALMGLARVATALGEPIRAEGYALSALDQTERWFGSGGRVHARSVLSWAQILAEQSRLPESREQYRRAICLLRECRAPASEQTLAEMELALLGLEDREELPDCEQRVQAHLLALAEKYGDIRHPDFADAHSRLAALFSWHSLRDLAASHAREATAITEAWFGDDSVAAARRMRDQWGYEITDLPDSGTRPEASMIERAFTILSKALGPFHDEGVGARFDLAYAFGEDGEIERANALYDELEYAAGSAEQSRQASIERANWIAAWSRRSPKTPGYGAAAVESAVSRVVEALDAEVEVQSSLALSDLARCAEILLWTEAESSRVPAARILDSALAIMADPILPEDPAGASRLNQFAHIAIELGRPQDAIELLDRAARIFMRFGGPSHFELRAINHALSSQLLKVGLENRARAAALEAIEVCERSFGLESRQLGTDLNTYAFSLYKARDLESSEVVARRGLKIRLGRRDRMHGCGEAEEEAKLEAAASRAMAALAGAVHRGRSRKLDIELESAVEDRRAFGQYNKNLARFIEEAAREYSALPPGGHIGEPNSS